MSLFTKEQFEQLLRNGSPENTDKDNPPVVKVFMPMTKCVWLLSEIEPDENPHIAFGLADLGMGYPELGYISLVELTNLKGPLGLEVEVDKSFKGKYPMSIYDDAARVNRVITVDESDLAHANFLSIRKHIHPKPD